MNINMDLLEMLQFPFMQRAFIAGIFLAILLASLGIIARLKNMAFFGDGIAHASLAGIAIAILAGISPLPIGIIWALIIAVIIFYLEKKTALSSDTLIGILFTASMSLGVILMNFTQGYQPELISFLFGNILSITKNDLLIITIISSIILIWFFLSIKKLTLLALSEEMSHVHGIPITKNLLLFYLALAVATVLGVKILGIILVSALLILPSAISRLMTNSFKSYSILSIILSEIIVLSGLILSYFLDLPSGATIVLTGTIIFFLVTILKPVFTKS